jgi:hypothetical protein
LKPQKLLAIAVQQLQFQHKNKLHSVDIKRDLPLAYKVALADEVVVVS